MHRILSAVKSSGIIRILNARLAYILHFLNLHFLNLHFTPLALLLFITAGSALIFIMSYVFRYSHYDYWTWRNRAVSKVFCWCFTLIAIKITLRSLTN